MPMESKTACTDCGSPLGRSVWSFWDKGDYGCNEVKGQVVDAAAAGVCCCPKNARLCTTCFHKHPLFVVPPLEDNDPNDISKGKIHRFCKACFQEKSSLDFSRTYDRINAAAAPPSSPETEKEISISNTIFVFVHGGSSSRALFHAHAKELKERFGHGSILLDLPGHGSLADVDIPLNLESCAKTLEAVLTECNITAQSNEKIIYVGGSLGAYVGFYLLGQFKDVFDGAVLMDCGQNVGPGASFKAKAGLVMMSWLGKKFSNATLMGMMLDVTAKSKADYKLVETVFGAGWFFDQAQAQVECLRLSDPALYIPKISVPILFMNGSMDYRDSENKWLEISMKNDTTVASELKVYEGGDHFFMHDSRFVEDVLESLHVFAKKVPKKNSH
jgi:pimeloyl-ACP methyl ester carboxylesterase